MRRFVLFFTSLLVGICTSAQITNFEYFIDKDPGVGKGSLVNKSFTGTGQLEIPTTGLVSGFHNLVIRAKQANGKWSISENRPFYIQPQIETVGSSSLVAYEYFMDTDPGVGNGTHVAIAKNTKLAIEELIKTTHVTYGFHILGLRFFDNKGKASITESRPFYIMQQIEKEAAPKIVLLEYSIDTLGVFGSGSIINVAPNSVIKEDVSLPYSDLAKGSHTLYMRAKDSRGVWSMAESTTFNVVNNSAPVAGDQTLSVNENSPKGTKIGKINATDPDGNTLTFSITQGNEKAVFSINASGELIVNDRTSLDFETNPLFTLTVSVSDGIASVNSTITVNLINVIEVGINEKLISSIACYPNPSSGVFIINGFNQNENCNLEVFTLNGKLIYQRQNVNSQTEVDISNETNGVYLLKVTSNEKVVTKKIVLNK